MELKVSARTRFLRSAAEPIGIGRYHAVQIRGVRKGRVVIDGMLWRAPAGPERHPRFGVSFGGGSTLQDAMKAAAAEQVRVARVAARFECWNEPNHTSFWPKGC